MMSSEGGIVKKLLFPGYDAGRNDTYLPTSGNKANSIVSSDASTAVRDNRSLVVSPPKVARSISSTAVVFPFDDEVAARNPEHDDQSGSTNMSKNQAFEEEATPEQTAFGKQLLFQRNIVNPKTVSEEDALSTASESGTLIEHGNRMLELDQMIQDEEEDPKKVLAMPTLDEDSPRSSLNQLLRSPKRTNGPTANTILSSAMRRIAASSPSSSTSSVRSPVDTTTTTKRSFARRRINTKVLPMRSCFSFDTAKDTAVPYRSRSGKTNMGSKSWDAGGQVARAFSTPTRIGPTHRLDIEREDAIDILSCLVERGVSWKPGCHVAVEETPKASEAIVLEMVRSLDVSDDRKACLKELVKSHEYALEMKRASKSAGVWLQSIGRQSPSSNNKVLLDDTTTVETELGPAVTDLTDETTTTTASPMDLVTVKALLHAAQREVKEKTEQNERLNDELAQCRAEIGRLNTLNSQFRSNVNRSILDENDDVEDEEETEEPTAGDRVLVDQLDTSFVRESAQEESKIDQYRTALQEANEIIAKLHAEKGVADEAPVVTLPQHVDEDVKSLDNSPSNKEERMINVRMLDAENFETDWDDMVPPLPTTPPEHDLRSPIVSAVLQSWTTDRGLHDSLLKWVDQILETDDEVPPLTLSGLDHQVRDGFCLHILPLLLRKPDIHVNVQTRLQRRTTYDLAVTVEPVRPHVQDSSVATTAVISNRAPIARLSYDEFVEPGIRSPDDEEPGNDGAWTNIGGALWGSLTSARRKPNADVEEPYHRVVSAPAGRIGVTFVEYRGHCMVSDVAADSPLLNWVYPSDVLIAIDELPVSGMRVRDIIKVLKDRSEQQRALRVVSSHSMSTLT